MNCRATHRTPFVHAGARAILFAILFALIACGGGTTSPGGDGSSPATGSVDVTIAGLPGGVDGSVSLEGRNGFTRSITSSSVVGGVPVGDCTVTAHPIERAPGDTMVVVRPVVVVPVVENQTSSVTLTYENSVAGAASLRAFHGPLVFQGAQHSDSYIPVADYGKPPFSDFEVDTYTLPYPAGYVLDGCEIVGTDVTASGISINTSSSGSFGSGSAAASLTVQGDTSVTITASAQGSASASTAFVGNGSSTGSLNLGYPGSNGLYDACIEVSNPQGTPFDLVFTWSYDGRVTNTDRAYWHHRFVYQIDPSICGTNATPTELYWGRDSTGPSSDAGTARIHLTGAQHLIAFGMWAEASGSWAMDFQGRGGDGNASCNGSVTIAIER